MAFRKDGGAAVKRMRVLLVALMAASVLGGLAAPAEASHRCADPDIFEEDHGISETFMQVCEYGPHDPAGTAWYVFCWLSPTC